MRATTDRLRTGTAVVLVALVAASVLDPSGGLVPHLKYALLAVFGVMAAAVGLLSRGAHLAGVRRIPLLVHVGLFAGVLPAWGLYVHLVRDQTGPWSTYAGALLYVVVVTLGAAAAGLVPLLRRAVVGALTALAGVVWVLFGLRFVLSPESIYHWGRVHDVYVSLDRSYGVVTVPYVYHYASPVLVLAGAYWVHRASGAGRRLAPTGVLAVVLGAMLLSGTRAAMVATLVLVGVYVLAMSRRAFWVLALAGVATVVALLPRLQVLFATSGGLSSRSNARKLDLLHSYADLFADPIGLLAGYGLGSCVQSAARGICMPVTELTYLDLVRVFGLVGALAYLALLLLPLVLGWKRHRWVVVGTATYLLTAAVNPYLFSTNGLLVVAVAVLNAYADDAAPPARLSAGSPPTSGAATPSTR